MPVESYYRGKGRKVMKSMTEQYGEEKGKRVFYATAKKKGQEPPERKKKRRANARIGAAALAARM